MRIAIVLKATAWGDIFAKNSITAPKGKNAGNPAELAGDLGIVGPMSDPRGGNPRVPDAVRRSRSAPSARSGPR